MRKFWLGVLVGCIISGGIAFAANRITLQNGGGTEVGTVANPITVQIN